MLRSEIDHLGPDFEVSKSVTKKACNCQSEWKDGGDLGTVQILMQKRPVQEEYVNI